MSTDDSSFGRLPGSVKNNLAPQQWEEVRPRIVTAGTRLLGAAIYVSLKASQRRQYEAGDLAEGLLLAARFMPERVARTVSNSTPCQTVPWSRSRRHGPPRTCSRVEATTQRTTLTVPLRTSVRTGGQ